MSFVYSLSYSVYPKAFVLGRFEISMDDILLCTAAQLLWSGLIVLTTSLCHKTDQTTYHISSTTRDLCTLHCLFPSHLLTSSLSLLCHPFPPPSLSSLSPSLNPLSPASPPPAFSPLFTAPPPTQRCWL